MVMFNIWLKFLSVSGCTSSMTYCQFLFISETCSEYLKVFKMTVGVCFQLLSSNATVQIIALIWAFLCTSVHPAVTVTVTSSVNMIDTVPTLTSIHAASYHHVNLGNSDEEKSFSFFPHWPVKNEQPAIHVLIHEKMEYFVYKGTPCQHCS